MEASSSREDPGLLRRAEVRDVLAWLRLLLDPHDAAAVVRALVRPPVELRQIDLARVIQVARRRKLDLVGGLAAATESPQVPPEARERIGRFVALHRDAAAALEALAPERFLERLVELVEAPGRALCDPAEAAVRGATMDGLRTLAHEFVAARPQASTQELIRHLTATPAPMREPDADSGDEAGVDPDPLAEALQLLRAEVLADVERIGGRLAELRLDTDLDISHGVVRYLELLKLSALMQRPPGESVEEALEDVNLRLLAAATPLQREILQSSPLDVAIRSPADLGPVSAALAPREGQSLVPFLPRKGVGLALSASDIQTYRSCPLRYKFARVLRIPSEQTVGQRFGIAVHQVLERYHAEGASSLERLLELLDASLRRSGIGAERGELRAKARTALTRYHARLGEDASEPVWFERAFSFRLGPHHLRGRVDRVDRRADGSYELIDYKTSRPKTPEQLREDVQLSLYALAARADWLLESASEAYYYVLDDLKVPVAAEREVTFPGGVEQVVLEVGEGILAQRFEPTPSPHACALCDYRIACPAAEA